MFSKYSYNNHNKRGDYLFPVVPAQIQSLVGSAAKGRWLGGMVAAGAGMYLNYRLRDKIHDKIRPLSLRLTSSVIQTIQNIDKQNRSASLPSRERITNVRIRLRGRAG